MKIYRWDSHFYKNIEQRVQTLMILVLLPLVELTSEPNNYGFRPYIYCKMAIGAVKANLMSMDPVILIPI